MKEKFFYGPNLLKKIGIVLAILSTIINVIVYRYLPYKVGIHTNGNGIMDSYVSKTIFIVCTPVTLLVIDIYLSKFKNLEALKVFALGIIIFVVNILIIFSNIKL